jgi:hypothetical protein
MSGRWFKSGGHRPDPDAPKVVSAPPRPDDAYSRPPVTCGLLTDDMTRSLTLAANNERGLRLLAEEAARKLTKRAEAAEEEAAALRARVRALEEAQGELLEHVLVRT